MKPEAADNRGKRWWPRSFSLRLAMMVLTILAVGLGWLGAALQRAVRESREDQRIAKSFLALGPRIQVRIKFRPSEPLWLRKLAHLAGMGQIERVVELHLSGIPLDDEQIIDLAQLTQLRNLQLATCEIDDEGLGKLSSLSRLEELSIRNDFVTDAGLQLLASYKNLRRLHLSGKRVMGPGLDNIRAPHLELLFIRHEGSKESPRPPLDARLPKRFLARFPRLKVLTLIALNVTDEDLSCLEAPIEKLSLNGTLISDRKVSLFRSSSTLQRISLQGTEITDGALKSLATCPSLAEVSLCFTQVTAAGVRQLAELPKLREVDVHGTSIPRDTAQSLNNAAMFRGGARISF